MSTKADKLADSTPGAESLDVLFTAIHGQDWIPEGNGLNLSDEEYRAWEDAQLERLHAAMDAEQQKHRASHITLQRVRRVLREFALTSPITASALQPVLALAHELNPSLREELDTTNPFL